MAYIKSKVNQSTLQVEPGTVLEGETLNADWLNHIQTQLEKFYLDYETKILNGWRICFFKLEIEPTSNEIQVQGALIGNPVVYVNGHRKTSYNKATGPDGTSDFSFNKFSDKIVAETISIIGTDCIVYYYSAFPHSETHSIGSSDVIDINNLGGLTAAEINALIVDYVNEAQIANIATNIKRSSANALCIRALQDGQGLENEIYDIGLI